MVAYTQLYWSTPHMYTTCRLRGSLSHGIHSSQYPKVGTNDSLSTYRLGVLAGIYTHLRKSNISPHNLLLTCKSAKPNQRTNNKLGKRRCCFLSDVSVTWCARILNGHALLAQDQWPACP